jgi:ABC-type branched-subunit amino acid transport system substrate-binding protein
MKKTFLQLTAALLLAGTASAALAADCKITVGLVMELTGPAGEYGQAGAKSVEMAFRDINDAGGVLGCDLVTDTRDSQSAGNVAVDAGNPARQHQEGAAGHRRHHLVGVDPDPDLGHRAGRIVQISPASSSPTLTALAREGKTNGIFFRTITSDALQGTAAAKYAIDSGFKKLAIIHVNNDFGVNMVAEFSRAYKALGGTIVSTTPYNEKQSSYASEVTAAMGGESRTASISSATPVDGATIARTWISQGGVQKFLLNDGMNSPDFIDSVGARLSQRGARHVLGHQPDGVHRLFHEELQGLLPASSRRCPAADRSYDAGVIAGLAIAIAGSQGPGKDQGRG